MSFKEQREFDGMEDLILQKEQKLKDLELESQSMAVVSNSQKLVKITEEMSGLQQEIDQLYLKWSELSTRA